MDIVSLVLLAVGLAMDAFSVSISSGIALRSLKFRDAGKIGLFFGVFQFLMPCIGWLLGTGFAVYITSFDHWIAFILLGFIGGKMLWEAAHPKEEETVSNPLDNRLLFILAIATSIDALAVGVTFASMGMTLFGTLTGALIPASALIGVITFAISSAGVCIGHKSGDLFGSKAEIVGGVVLIGIGAKILIEHLLG